MASRPPYLALNIHGDILVCGSISQPRREVPPRESAPGGIAHAPTHLGPMMRKSHPGTDTLNRWPHAINTRLTDDKLMAMKINCEMKTI